MSSFLEKCGKKLKYVIRKGKWNEQNKINMKSIRKDSKDECKSKFFQTI